MSYEQPSSVSSGQTDAVKGAEIVKRSRIASLKAHISYILLGVALVGGGILLKYNSDWLLGEPHVLPRPTKLPVLDNVQGSAPQVVAPTKAYTTRFTSVPIPIELGSEGEVLRSVSCEQAKPDDKPKLRATYISHGRLQPVLVCEWE